MMMMMMMMMNIKVHQEKHVSGVDVFFVVVFFTISEEDNMMPHGFPGEGKSVGIILPPLLTTS